LIDERKLHCEMPLRVSIDYGAARFVNQEKNLIKKQIHIAIGSTTSQPGAVAENLRQIAEFAAQAGRDGEDLLLTPELSASGYGPYPEVLATAERSGEGPIFQALAGMARENGVVVCAGFVEAFCDKRYLAHYAVYPDGQFIIQRKHRVMLTELPLNSSGELIPPDPARPSDDPADPGQPRVSQFSFFEVKGVRCAFAICADSGITGLDDLLEKEAVEVLLVPTGAGGERKDRVTTEEMKTPEGRAKYLHWLERVFFPGKSVGTCIERRRAMAAVNLCGFDGRKHHHIGHGMIITPMGEVPALIHGLPNLDRQRPMYAHAVIDL
jgi:predicted amidohydrolase